MRLVCPNCGAQYEVDPSVIPETGRDVQCSSCGHAWFHPGAAAGRVAAAVAASAGQDEPVPREVPPSPPEVPEPAPAETPATVPIAEPEPAPQEIPDETLTEWPEDEPPSDDPGMVDDTGAAPAPAGAAPELRRKTLDDAVMAILREEAEREARARQAEGGSVESQPELGLAVAAARGAAAAAVTERSARLRDIETEPAEEPAEEPADEHPARKAALPDIEEINSTLRATSERGDEAAARDAPETLRRKRSGFRVGFSTAFLIAVVLLLLYVLAPAIAARVPSLAPVLSAYVAAVDHLRLWLDGALKSSTEAMRPAAQTGG